ncbi:S41 family peptidase [Candidatus Peregrinibacteria bacterium]|nr:S41 family peptidase [Candidatus Peregrinibacteria bacterium]
MKKLLVSLIIGLFACASFALAYDDVPPDSPYFYAVEYLRMNDVFPEQRLFKPDTLITKSDFIRYLVKLNNPEFKAEGKIKLPFKDTNDNSTYAPYFDEAIKLGILDKRDEKAEPYKKLDLMEALRLLFHSQSIPIPTRYVYSEMPYKDLKNNKAAIPLVMRAMEFDLITPQKLDYVGIYRRISKAEAARMIYKMDLVNLKSPSSDSDATGLDIFDLPLQKIISTYQLIQSNFVDRDKLDSDAIADKAMRAMTETLDDPYSAYLNPKENQAFSDDLDGQIEGIGAYLAVEEETGKITIVSPMKSSPAEKAGILPGDVIKKVDDLDISGLTLYEVVNKIKGPKGTSVSLTLDRNGGAVTVNVIRDVIIIKALEYEVKNDNVMVVRLAEFNSNAASELQEVSEIVSNNPKIKGVILDLRNNPGGLLDAAIKVLGFFLPANSEAVIISYNYFNYTQATAGKGDLSSYPLIVLINKGSASASEIVAGAIKDHGKGKIIGETSFGKGTVQEVNYFLDNSSLKLTVARWLTPKGHDIQKNGITPDIEVIKGTGTMADEQMERALFEIDKMTR